VKMGEPFTFVTVTFEQEYALLGLQARSMARFVSDDLVAGIVVIDNAERSMPARFRQQLCKEYGPLAAKLRVLRPGAICAVPRIAGYRSQQILKLCVADEIATPRYIVLDAKNHFIAPVERSLFEAPDGRARISTTNYELHALRPGFEHVMRYLGVDPKPHLRHFATAVPPIVLDRATVRSLIADIEQRSGRGFADEFVASGLLEFFLYTGWITARRGSLDALYELRSTRRPYIWRGNANPDGVTRAIRASNDSKAEVFAVHRLALAGLDAESTEAVCKFWTEHGLFATSAEAQRFVADYRRSFRRASRRAQIRKLSNRLRTIATGVPQLV